MEEPRVAKYLKLTKENDETVREIAKSYGCSYNTAVNIMLKSKHVVERNSIDKALEIFKSRNNKR